MKKMFYSLATFLAVFSASAAIFTPTPTIDDARQVANDLKMRNVEGSQAQLASYLQSGKIAAAVHPGPTTNGPGIAEQIFGKENVEKPTEYSPGIGEQVFGGIADKP